MKDHATRLRRERIVARKLSIAIATLIGTAGVLGEAAAQVVASGRTSTTVTPGASVTRVDTTSVVGSAAFNDFSAFNVGNGHTVNLNLPTGTSALINLIGGGRSQIDGTVNALKDGRIGGNVFFANPDGFLISSSGVMNAGSLHLSAPSRGFMDSFFLGKDQPNGIAVDLLMQGRQPIEPHSLIEVRGRLNAADSIDLRSGKIVVGNTAQLRAGVPQAEFDQMVNTTGITQAGQVVAVQGRIFLAATGDVDISGRLDAAATPDNGGQIDVTSGGRLDVHGGAVLNTRSGGGTGDAVKDGSIKLLAESANTAGTDLVSTVTSEASVNIADATLTGGDISIDARSQAIYNKSIVSLADVPIATSGSLGLADLAGDVTLGAMQTRSRASVSIGAGANIQASGTLAMKADSTAETTFSQMSLWNMLVPFSVDFLKADVDSAASVSVQAGAALRAKTLVAEAVNKATLDVSVTSISTEDNVAVGVALTSARANASVDVAAGASVNVTGDVRLAASNTNSFNTSMSQTANDDGVAGGAAAIFDGQTAATVRLGTGLVGARDVTLAAHDDTLKNRTNASSTVGGIHLLQRVYGIGTRGAEMVQKYLLNSKNGTPKADDRADSDGSPFKLSGALSYIDFSSGATAEVANGVHIDATGNVVVAATVRDAQIHAMSASSADQDTSSGNQNSTTEASVSGAVTLGFYRHDANARVGDGATITAGQFGLLSDVSLPYAFTWGKFDNLDALIAKATATLGFSDQLTGYANASTSAHDGDLGVGGAVSYLDFTNRSRATVGDGASVTVRPSTNGTWGVDLANGTRADFDAAVHVKATMETEGAFSAGNLGLTGNGSGGSGDAASVGGAYNQINFDNSVEARVGRGAVIGGNVVNADGTAGSRVDVAVTADATERLFVLAPSAGRGGGFGLNGTFAYANTAHETMAVIDAGAQVTANQLRVAAQDDTVIWAVSGGINKSESASVGLGNALIEVATDTQARIGSNQAGADAVNLLASNVDVGARTDGRVESIAVAGAITTQAAPEKPKEPKPKKDPADQGFFDKLGGKLSTLGTALKYTLLGDAQAPQTAPKFGLGVSGSSAINLVAMNTSAAVSNANITLEDGSLAVTAVNNTDIGAFSGAAALTRANAQSSRGSAAIAGALALNDLANTTEATLHNARVTDATRVDVMALSGGEQLSVALGLAVNASADQSKAASAAGSVSVSTARNAVRATVDDSTITGQAHRTDVDVLAYDRTTLGTGGGALLGGGRGGVGAAVTYSDIGNTATAIVDNTAITGAGDVQVQALTASLIGAGGAMVAATGSGNNVTLGGAFVFNDIGNVVQASIRNGSRIDASNVAVRAADTARINGLDAVIDQHDGAGGASGYDYSGAGAGNTDTDGASIVAVAGNVQAGGNNVGASMLFNTIGNRFMAEIDQSTVTADASVDVVAHSGATIFGYAAGVGVGTGQFSGGGSVVINDIGNTITARIGGDQATITAGALHVAASDASHISAAAGQINASLGTGAVGAAVSVNEIGNTVEASVTDAALYIGGANTIRADNTSRIDTLAASAGGAPSFAINGSAATATIANTTTAQLVNATAVGDTQQLSVLATDSALIRSLSGSAAGSGSAAFGAAATVNQIDSVTSAGIHGGNVEAGNVTVAGTADATIDTLAASGAGSGSVAVAGSFATSLLGGSTSAVIDNGATVRAWQNVGVLARRDDRVTVAAGGVGIGFGVTGVGAAAVVNVMDAATYAGIVGNGTQVDALALDPAAKLNVQSGGLDGLADLADGTDLGHYARSDLAGMRETLSVSGVAVNATATHSVESLAATVGGGTYAGVGVTTQVDVMGGQTVAEVRDASVNLLNGAGLAQGLDVRAADHAYANSFVGALGGGAVGVAAAADTHVFDGTTRAQIVDSNVRARGTASIVAQSSQSAASVAAGGAAGLAGVAGTGSLAKFTSTTQAALSGGTTEAGALAVDADHLSRMALGAGALSGGGVAMSGSFGVGLDQSQTVATIDGAAIRATRGVSVTADSRTEIDNWSVSGAGGGFGAGAGSAAVVLTEGATQAWVANSRIAGSTIGNDVTLTGTIQSATIDNNRLVGTDAGGQAMGGTLQGTNGATLSDAQVWTETDAKGRKATLVTGTLRDASGALAPFEGELRDGVLYDPNGTAIATLVGAAPQQAIAGAGSLTVSATDRTTVDNLAGGAGLSGGAGVGAAAVVTRVDNTVTAWIDHSDVKTQGDVTLQARAERDLSAQAVSAGVGFTGAGLAGSVAVTLVGQGLSGDAAQELDHDGNGTLSKVEALGQQDKVGASGFGNALDNSTRTALNQRAGVSVKSGINAANLDARTAAVISGSTVVAGGDVRLDASESDRNDILVGAAAGGFAGVGAAVGVMQIRHNVDALVDGASTLTAGGAIRLHAGTRALDANAPAAQVLAYQGSGGVVALGAAVATVDIANQVSARVSGGATAQAGNDVAVTADDATDANAEAQGYQVGLVAAGAAVATAEKSGQTIAAIGDDSGLRANVAAQGDIMLGAQRSGRVGSLARAGSGGAGAATGSGATATDDGIVTASIANATVQAGGTASVVATTAPQTQARAEGYNGAVYAAIGASVAKATAATTANAAIMGSSIVADGVDVRAATMRTAGSQNADAFARATGGAGLVGANATDADALTKTASHATIGGNTVLLVNNATLVSASSDTGTHANANGVTVGGVLAVGANIAQADANTDTTATIENGVTGQAGATLTVQAIGTDETTAQAMSGSGGLISGAAAVADTRNQSHTTAALGGGTSSQALLATGSGGDGKIVVDALHTARFNGEVDSVNAALVGASGALTRHDVDASVTAAISDGANLVSHGIEATAANLVRKPWLDGGEYNAEAGSGGFLNGSAVISESDINTVTRTLIGQNASVRITGDRDDPGRTRFTAYSDVQARDKTRLDSGGVLDIARAESLVHDHFDTAVVVAQGANLDTVGDASFAARVASDIETSANAKTYGLSSAAQGNSAATVTGTLAVNIAGGATIRADGNVNLLVGSDADGNTNAIRAVARTDLFNKSIVPVQTDPNADAAIDIQGRVDVANGAVVRSVKDVNLYAERGNLLADGKGVGKDLWREAAAAVGSFFSNLFGGGDISLDIEGGSSKTDVANRVNIAGNVQAGIQNKQILRVEDNADGSLKVLEQSEGITFRETTMDLVANLQSEINAYTRARQQYAAAGDAFVAQIDAEISRLQQELAAFGGVSSKTVKVIAVDPVYASGGDVNVKADVLTVATTGKVNAPGDALINIDSSSNRYLQVSKLEIPEDQGGHVTFNNASVTTLADITQRNRGQESAGSGTLVTGTASGKPAISVTQRYQALNTGDPNAQSPDLLITGDVLNLGGNITIESKEGSVLVKNGQQGNGTMAGSRILGQTVSITAGRDFVMSPTDGYFHVAGDPSATWDAVAQALEAKYRAYSLRYGTDPANWSNPNGAIETATPGSIPLASGVGIIAGNNVFLNARVLNINGLVQAGLPDWSIVLDAERAGGTSIAAQIAKAAADYAQQLKAGVKPGDIKTRYELSGVRMTGTDSLIHAVYDVVSQEIVLDNVRVQGGYMELTGQILNTGGGELRVMDGYGRINVQNDTNYTVRLNTLDVGSNIEGTIKITDTSAMLFDGQPLSSTIYRRIGNQITQETVRDGAVFATTNLGEGRTTTYTPLSGLRYGWTSGQKQTFQRELVNYTTKGCYGAGGDGCASDDPSDSWRTGWYALESGKQIYDRTGFVTRDLAHESDAYLYEFQTRTVKDTTHVSTYDTGKYGCGIYWCDSEIFVYQYEKQDFHKHSVKADYAIGISFVGHDTGSVNVTGKGNVVIGSTVNAGNGTASITSTAGSINAADRTVVVGQDVILSAATGIGNNGNAISVDVRDGGLLNASTVVGDVSVRERSGDMVIGRIGTGAGTVTLEADASILAGRAAAGGLPDIRGTSLNLIAHGGTLGTAARALEIQTDGVNGKLDAEANNDIFLSQRDGDLRLNRVVSHGRDVSIVLDNGSFIDANDNSTRDTRTLAQLESLWTDMQLLGAGAQASTDQALRSLVGLRDREYQTYWNLRNLRQVVGPDGNPMLVADAYDPATASPELQALHARFSHLTTTDGTVSDLTQQYQAGFTYAGYVTAEDKASVTTGGTWTANELKYGISRAVYNKTTTDTETQIEQPNIEARNVSLVARNGGVGALKGEVLIDASTAGSTLTQAQREALATAEADDVAVLPNGQLRIIQRDDVDVASTGAISITAATHVYLGSETDLNIDAVKAGDTIRVKGAGGIYSVATDPARPNLEGGSMVLEAGDGGVGTAANPLTTQIANGGTLTARGALGVHVAQLAGDLNVAEIYSPGAVSLSARAGNIVDARGPDRLQAIQAGSVALQAAGAIGSSVNPLALTVLADGQVTATALQGIFLGSDQRALALGDIVAGGDVGIAAAGGSLTLYGTVVGTDVALGSARGLVFAASGNVRAAGGLFLQGESLTMADGATAEAAGRIEAVTNRDMALGQLTAGADTADAIRLTAGGSITDANGDGINLAARAPGAGIVLAADGSIGAGDVLEIVTSSLDARSGGNLALASLGNLDAMSVTATGHAALDIAGSLAGGRLASGSADLRVAGNAALHQLTVAGNAGMRIGGALTAANLQASALSADIGGDVVIGQLASSGPARVTSGASLQIGDASADALVLQAAGTLAATQITAGSAQLAAGGDLNVGRLSATSDVLAAAGHDLRANAIQANTMTLSAGNQLRVDEARAQQRAAFGGRTIVANVRATDPAAPLTLVATGTNGLAATAVDTGSGALADRVDLTIDSAAGANFGRLWTAGGQLTMRGGALDVARGRVLDQFVFSNEAMRVLMDNRSMQPRPYDVQLYAPSTRFALNMNGNLVTTDAFVVLREPAFRTRTPAGENVSLRDVGADMSARANAVPRPDPDGSPRPAAAQPGQLIAMTGIPVGLGDLSSASWTSRAASPGAPVSAPGSWTIDRMLLAPCPPDDTKCLAE
ncbi:leukotoxin LktA family filamentous adhesin [Cupriavidus metallidurans]|uniref:leukotoxin LktA family filamentous adhesin n=2 Tax=Cupriavidus TaxID=106589 RepID=UPI001646F5DC|nr:leukotoxin LktA family filamentous adhesin [Cupriavidus metallidurans]